MVNYIQVFKNNLIINLFTSADFGVSESER
jgi:hypothetical protein